MDTIEHLKYPIGKFRLEEGPEALSSAIQRIASLPARLRSELTGLSKAQLDTPYREGGWTLRQVIHHLPDSHINAYTRFKLAMTENDPQIRPYDEAAWAECEEAKSGDVEMSLALLEALHIRWVAFIKTLSTEDLHRAYFHPETNRQFPLHEVLGLYAWHGDHHLAHITTAKKMNKW